MVYFVPLQEAHIQMALLSRDSQMGVLKFPKVGTPATLGPHNFVCKTLIKMKFKEKL